MIIAPPPQDPPGQVLTVVRPGTSYSQTPSNTRTYTCPRPLDGRPNKQWTLGECAEPLPGTWSLVIIFTDGWTVSAPQHSHETCLQNTAQATLQPSVKFASCIWMQP